MKQLFLILFILYGFGAVAQTSQPSSELFNPSSSVLLSSTYQELWRNQFEVTLPETRLVLQKPSSNLFIGTPNCLPGMFCKMEYKIETKSKLAPRFRLGSLSYTNWMEGKGGFYNRY